MFKQARSFRGPDNSQCLPSRWGWRARAGLSLCGLHGALVAAAMTIAVGVAAAADDPPPAADAANAPAADAEGWRPLFDGKTLTNWKASDFAGGGEVKVDNGLLVIGQGEPMTGVTWTGEALPRVNYEVRLEAQRVDGTDFFCALTFPVKAAPCTLVLGGWGGGVTGLSSINGFDASENETTGYHPFTNGQWYKVRLRVTDETIQAWLDDKQVANVEYPSKTISIRIECAPCKPFGIATFQTVGAIRNLQLRELKAESKEGT